MRSRVCSARGTMSPLPAIPSRRVGTLSATVEAGSRMLFISCHTHTHPHTHTRADR
jgi:hypothetical protein